MFSNIQDGNNMVITIWSTTGKMKENLEEKNPIVIKEHIIC